MKDDKGRPLTDDEVLAAAVRIKARRLNAARLKAFRERDSFVTIRWDNPGGKFGESYTGIEVPADAVAAVVEAYFSPLVAS